MDANLLKSREAFRNAASRNIGIPRSASSASNVNKTIKKEPKKKTAVNKVHDEAMLKNMKSLPNFDYATGTAGAGKVDQMTHNSTLFGMMAKIVDFMKKRHLEGQAWSLTLRDCLEEMKANGVPPRTEKWLQDKLPENPKLQFDGENKFCFKPPYKLKSDQHIVDQLLKNYRSGKGAILLSELNECFAKADERMEKIGDPCITIPCQVNKKKDKAYFYNDSEVGIAVDDDFKALWRGSSVENLDEKKIEEYLNKQGLSIIKDQGLKRLNHGHQKRKQTKRRTNAKIQNTHMAGILEEYETT